MRVDSRTQVDGATAVRALWLIECVAAPPPTLSSVLQGGMFYVELLTQPPQPKRVRQWTMSSGG